MNILLGSLYPFSPELLYPEIASFSAIKDHRLYRLVHGKNSRVMPGLSMIGLDPFKQCPKNLEENIEMFEYDLDKKLPNIQTLLIDDFITDEDVIFIKKWLSNIEVDKSLEGYDQILFEGVEVGKYAIFNTLRQFRIDRITSVTPEVLDRYYLNLGATVLSVVLAQNISKVHSFDHLFLSHYDYCASKGLYHGFELRYPIQLFALTAPNMMGTSLSHRLIGWCQKIKWADDLFDCWNQVKTRPRCDYEKSTEHYQNLFKGNSRADYSSPVALNSVDIFEKWGLSKDVKIVLIALSCADEIYAAKLAGSEQRMKPIFDNQLDWLKQLLPVIKDRTDYQFVIRVHPRDYGANIPSLHLKEIMEYFKELPQHIILNIPQDRVSSHEIMKYCSLLLSSWSTTAIEMGLFGVPTLSIVKDHECIPQWDMGVEPKSQGDYFHILNSLLSKKEHFNFDLIKLSFRWGYFFYNLVHLDLLDCLNYKKVMLPKDEDMKLREESQRRYLETNSIKDKYNPIYLSLTNTLKEADTINACINESIEPYIYKLREDTTCAESIEIESIRKSLAALLITMYNFPIDKSIQYVNSLPSVLDSKVYYLIKQENFQGTLWLPDLIKKICSHETLLINLAEFCYGNKRI